MEQIHLEKITRIKEKFSSLHTPQERYTYLIELGRALPPFPDHLKTPDNLVAGCQSQLFLHASCDSGRMHFLGQSDALISAGLCALLLEAYNDCSPQTVLLNPPIFLQEIGIFAALSPTRSNGLVHIYLKMKLFTH